MKPGPLAGCGIVVTRPREQAGNLGQLVEAAGARAILFPTLEILPPLHPGDAVRAVDELPSCRLAIFVSPNAVRCGLALVDERLGRWPPGVEAAAVASGTRRALEGRGFGAVTAPTRGHDSEALLALPRLSAVAGQRVAVFRGEGGRELLADTLAARGAEVVHVACYRRARPALDAVPLLEAWARGEIDAITASSSEGLDNFIAMVGAEGAARLVDTPLFVTHERIAAHAAARGAREVRVAGPGDAELIERLVAYFATNR